MSPIFQDTYSRARRNARKVMVGAAIVATAGVVVAAPWSPGASACPSATANAAGGPDPWGGCFASAANTGVPAGTTLTAYTGPSNVTTANTTITGKTIGCIRVSASGVVIRNSQITCTGNAVYAEDGAFSGTALLVEDSEISCNDAPGSHALAEARITARRVNISHCENGGDINQNFTVEDSYVHDMYNGGAAHMDGFQLSFGHLVNGSVVPAALNVTFRHNTIMAMGSNGTFGTSAIISNSGGDTNILIEKNLMAGGAFTLYCEQNATGSNYQVLNNVFSRVFKSTVGFYGPSTDCSDEVQSGNTYENGVALSLP